MQKKVNNYFIEVNHYCKGNRATFFKTSSNDTNNGAIYLAKCFNKKESLTDQTMLINEIKNSKYFSDANSTTEFVDSIESKNRQYIIYKFFESISLEFYLKSNSLKENNIDERCRILILIISALAHLHIGGNLIHGNLSPAHILINLEKQIVRFCGNSSIFKFGNSCSKYAENLPYNTSKIDTTKKIYQLSYDEKMNIYNLGVIIYQIFSKNQISSSLVITNKDIDALPFVNDNIKDLIRKCLENNPDKRPNAYDILYSHNISKIIDYLDSDSNTIETKCSNSDEDIPNIRRLNSLDPLIATSIEFGEGGFGKVIQVQNKLNGINFALKMISLETHSNDLKYVFQEINLLKDMKDYGFIVKLEDYFLYNDYLCLLLEECNGGDLENYIQKLKFSDEKLKNDDIRMIAWNIAEGLYFLHSNKIVHRDIKPKNILLQLDNCKNLVDAKICDLGISKKLTPENSYLNSICGTELYMSPEMRDKSNGKKVNLSSKIDTYGFGLILNYLAYGKEPKLKRKYNKKHVAKIKKHSSKMEQYMNNDLNDLINRCLTNDPTKRISINEIINHPFLKKLKIGLFSNIYNIDIPDIINQSNNPIAGFKDKSGKYWIKIYNINIHESQLKKVKLYCEREIDFLIKCKNIPHMVQLVDYGFLDKTESKIIKVMQCYNGGNLAELIKSRKKNFAQKLFQIYEIKIVAKCLLEFLNQLHKKNYCHRSLNPRHVLTEMNDFTNEIQEALVCGYRTSKTKDINYSNSFLYSDVDIVFTDINILNRGYFSEDSDIWSVGMIIYFMIVGKPFLSTWQEYLNFKKNPSFQYPDNIDKSLTQILKFCTKSIFPNEYSSVSIEEFLLNSNIF